ncbi:MAG TPA: hypothetical protein VMV56_11905 [Williamwhitmania sp.]|nr:hypothetical protein [Williamwhitmania sp.]
MESNEEQLKNLKRKLLEKRNKLEAMLFELRELNQKYRKPDNSEIVRLLESLGDKIEALEMKPEIRVESKEVRPIVKSPKVKVEVNQEKVIREIKLLKEKINSKSALQTNKLISDLIKKVETLELKPEIKVESKEVKVEPIFDPYIEVKPADVKVEKTDVKNPINWLLKSIETLFAPFILKVSGFINRVSKYIKEPDKIVVTDRDITEFYGDKKVIYRINDDGRKMEIERDES